MKKSLHSLCLTISVAVSLISSSVIGWSFTESTSTDTDGDHWSDAYEQRVGTDPEDAESYPDNLILNGDFEGTNGWSTLSLNTPTLIAERDVSDPIEESRRVQSAASS